VKEKGVSFTRFIQDSSKKSIDSASDNNSRSSETHPNIESSLKLLHKEIENLKFNQSIRDDTIIQLNEKIKSLEIENKSLMLQLQENFERFNKEIQQRSADNDFLKRAYDEQKNKHNRDYEMISCELYEMCLKFMSLKNELNKKSPAKKRLTVPSNTFSIEKYLYYNILVIDL